MKLFEQSWTNAGKTYIREFNPSSGKSERTLTNYKPEYFIRDNLGSYTGFLDGKKLRKVQGSSYNIPDAYNTTSAPYVAIREEYFGKKYNNKPGIFYFDIETKVGYNSTGFPNPEDALEEICLIQFFDTTSSKGYILGLEEWYYRSDYSYDFELEYITCKDEKELLNKYLELFKELDPLIIYAWNGDNFDFPYLFNRLKNLKISTGKLSNHGKVKLDTKKLDNGIVTNSLSAQGHWYSDLMEIYKKFVFDTVPSYGLDYIGEKETGINKVDHSNYLKFDDFRTGKYVILGNESDETKNTKIYRAAKGIGQDDRPEIKAKLQKYIKEKSYSEFCHYGALDFVILKGIDESRNFTQIMISMAEDMGCQIQDTLGTLKPWNAYISNTALKDNLVLPPKQSNNKPSIIGGFVSAPRVGKHRWILSADINSMYPLLGMVAHNMSAETFVNIQDRPKELQDMINKHFYDQDEARLLELYYSNPEVFTLMSTILTKYNFTMGFNGAIFSKNREGLIPKLVKHIYAERKLKKKEMFKYEKLALKESNKDKVAEYNHLEQLADTKQMTLKIMMNSLYGALAQQYFSLFNESFAAAITMNGRFYIRLMSKRIEEKLQNMKPRDIPYDIYNDTDSQYFSIDDFVDEYCKDKTLEQKIEFADRFYQKIIDPVVQDSIIEFSKLTNTMYPEYIGAEREIVADVGLWTAKKKYTARVRDNEGVRYDINNPYLKVTGLEIQQGGTAGFTKKYLKQAIPVILDNSDDEIKDWFQEVRTKYMDSHIIDKAKTIGVSKLQDPNWGKMVNGRVSSPPFGSKACIATNKYIIDNNLQEQFELLAPGEKVKILYLQKPNPLKADAFAFTDPKFADIFKENLDYDLNFEKFFIAPLDNMVKVLGIDVTKHYEVLDDW